MSSSSSSSRKRSRSSSSSRSSRKRSSSSSSSSRKRSSTSSDNSFVTVLINSHGRELRDERATPEQKQTLRRLSMAGKSGMLSLQGIPNMMPTIFYHAHELSKNTHMTFTEKLKKLSMLMCDMGFNEQLQKAHEVTPLTVTCKTSTAADWFLTSQVKYNQYYEFSVNNDTEPWDRDGIWLLDGSERVLKTVDFNPIKEKNDIMLQLRLLPSDWPLKKDDQPTENYTFSTTMFDLETRLKSRYNVKYVNFIDLSCRYNPKTLGQRVAYWFVNSSDDDEMEAAPDEIMEQVEVGGVVVGILKKQPRRLPSDWKYVKIQRNGAYVYANMVTGEISRDFPEAKLALRPRKRTIRGTIMENVKHPSIAGVRPMELPPGWKYMRDPFTEASFYVNEKTGEINPVVPHSFSRVGGKFAKSKSSKRKCVRSRTKSRKPRS